METQFGLRQNIALKWLKQFTEIGVLRKEGERKPTLTAQNVPHEKHLHALKLVFDLKPMQIYSELVANIK